MSKNHKHSSCSLKGKLELLKRIDNGKSATKVALVFFYILFGLKEISDLWGSTVFTYQ
jgi:hypothetical protein